MSSSQRSDDVKTRVVSVPEGVGDLVGSSAPVKVAATRLACADVIAACETLRGAGFAVTADLDTAQWSAGQRSPDESFQACSVVLLTAIECRTLLDELHATREEADRLRRSLAERRVVEQAKGVLMRRLNLDESDAHKRLQSESQNRRVPIGEVARQVIESDRLLSDPGA